ncbi:MAG: ABC transporter permease subunit [Halobacteriaceae archaeon]
MSWPTVARKDFQDAIRSRALWALTVLYVLFMAGFAYLFSLLNSGGGPEELVGADLVFFLVGPTALLVPLTALIIGYKSLAGEVESGSAKFLLGLPHTRRDALIGKWVGRAAVLAVSILVGIVLSVVVVITLYDQPSLDTIGLFTLLALFLGVVYVGIAVGLSGLTNSTSRATVYAAAFFVIFEVVWDFVPNLVWYLTNGSFFPPRAAGPAGASFDAPGWYFLLGNLSPTSAFSSALTAFAPGRSLSVQPVFEGGLPFYLTGPANVALMLAWLLLALALGYRRFREADL